MLDLDQIIELVHKNISFSWDYSLLIVVLSRCITFMQYLKNTSKNVSTHSHNVMDVLDLILDRHANGFI